MKCPFCNSSEDKVIDSREISEGRIIRRRRECLKCSKRFTTYEELREKIPYIIIKRDGSQESFDREKLVTGIMKACEKTSIDAETVEGIVDEIESAIQTKYDKEIKSQDLGELIMDKLHSLDEVAYLRFASVYRQFKDAGAFMEEIKESFGEGGAKG
ncbi:MAG: transcriptional regulator NrdR [Nitrospirota bacterium]